MGLFFNSLANSLCDSTGSGVISFDCGLKIIDYTSPAFRLLEIKDRIDTTLAAAGDGHGWKNWTEIARSVVTVGQTVRFEAVKTTTHGQTHLLDMTFAAVHPPDEKTIIGGGLIVTDVTNKVAMEAEMAQTERLATMGKVAEIGRAHV